MTNTECCGRTLSRTDLVNNGCALCGTDHSEFIREQEAEDARDAEGIYCASCCKTRPASDVTFETPERVTDHETGLPLLCVDECDVCRDNWEPRDWEESDFDVRYDGPQIR